MSDHWALWHDERGAAYVRPLFEGERRGHGYTGPLRDGETEIEVTDGAYPDKWALSTQKYRDVRTAELESPHLLTEVIEAARADILRNDGTAVELDRLAARMEKA